MWKNVRCSIRIWVESFVKRKKIYIYRCEYAENACYKNLVNVSSKIFFFLTRDCL